MPWAWWLSSVWTCTCQTSSCVHKDMNEKYLSRDQGGSLRCGVVIGASSVSISDMKTMKCKHEAPFNKHERTGHWKTCVNISGLFLHLHAISSGDHPREWLAQSFVQAVRTCRCTVSFTKSLVAASRHVSNSKTTKRDNRGYQSVRKISLVLMQCHWVAANEAHQLAVASFLLWDPAFHCSDDKTHTCRDVCMILHVFKPHADLQIGLS